MHRDEGLAVEDGAHVELRVAERLCDFVVKFVFGVFCERRARLLVLLRREYGRNADRLVVLDGSFRRINAFLPCAGRTINAGHGLRLRFVRGCGQVAPGDFHVPRGGVFFGLVLCYLKSVASQAFCPVNYLPNVDETRLQRDLGDVIRARRLALGLSQEELADRCRLHRTYIGSVERGERNISLQNIVRIAHALGTQVWALIQAAEQ